MDQFSAMPIRIAVQFGRPAAGQEQPLEAGTGSRLGQSRPVAPDRDASVRPLCVSRRHGFADAA